MQSVPYRLGPVIARRIYVVDGEPHKFELLLGQPQRCPDGIDYYCAFTIRSLTEDDSDESYAVGIDEFQSIQLALVGIASRLSILSERVGGRLRCEACGAGDIGFPDPLQAISGP